MNVCVNKYSNNKIHNSVGYVIRSPQTCPGREITHSAKGLGILLPVTAALIGQTPCYWMLQPAPCWVTFVVSTCVDANSALLCQPAACVWARGRAASWRGWWRPPFPFWLAAGASPPSRTATTPVSYTSHTVNMSGAWGNGYTHHKIHAHPCN